MIRKLTFAGLATLLAAAMFVPAANAAHLSDDPSVFLLPSDVIGVEHAVTLDEQRTDFIAPAQVHMVAASAIVLGGDDEPEAATPCVKHGLSSASDGCRLDRLARSPLPG